MLVTTTLGDLAEALQLGSHELVALVGGGGKTTSLFALGNQLRGRVVLTTTTKMGSERTGDIDLLVNPQISDIDTALNAASPLLVWGGIDGRKALGVKPEVCDEWFASPLVDSVVVEADGSRKRPFKAPLAYEPVVPRATTLLVACIGSSALGQPIDVCSQRPERVAAIAKCSVDDILTPERAAAVLTNSDGSQKSRPSSARFLVAAHRVGPDQRDAVADLAEAVADIDSSIDVVAVAETEHTTEGFPQV